MEKRIGTITIVISDKSAVKSVNDTLSQYSDGILSRQGLPLRDKGLNFINIVIEATLDEINALTGKLGRLEFVEVKAIVSKQKKKKKKNII